MKGNDSTVSLQGRGNVMGRWGICPTKCGIGSADYTFCPPNLSLNRQHIYSLLFIEIAATRWHMLTLKCTKFDFGWGSAT